MLPYFQVGIVVRDLDQAMEELGVALGVQWVGPRTREIDAARLRVAFAHTGPPYLELIEALPGTIWEATEGQCLHHLGYWAEDLEADAARLETCGMNLELDLGHARYHRGGQNGTRIELIDAGHKPEFLRRWGLPAELARPSNDRGRDSRLPWWPAVLGLCARTVFRGGRFA